MPKGKKIFAIIAAAGSSSRMQNKLPKQYLPIFNKTVIEYSICTLLDLDIFAKILVVLAKNDCFWDKISNKYPNIQTVIGGNTRMDSVISGLKQIQKSAQAHDMVLIHDAARPCVKKIDIEKLINKIEETNSIGGLLIAPITDSIRKVADELAIETINRDHLYRALTPQIFRFDVIVDAYHNANMAFEDESSATIAQGHKPICVLGSSSNIKITHPGDIDMIKVIISNSIR